MQETIDYNFLIIGRSGAGKSAATKLLTGDPSITVANSLKEVTTDVKFYRGIKIEINSAQGKRNIRFGVLDVPGLDKLNNRFTVRDKLLEELELRNISLNGIIYVSSLTERDTIDSNKLFRFIQQLPWPEQSKKNALIPLLTKYDNLIIDSPDQEIISIKQQYGKIFQALGYAQAWSKRVYWINHTKSLEFKMKIRQQIKQVYQKQINRLIDVTNKNKNLLTISSIKQYIEEEEQYVAEKLLEKILKDQIPCRKQVCEYNINLKILVRPKKFYQSITTVSASSIGMIISQLCKKDIPTSLSLILTGIPIALAFLNLTKSTTKMAGKNISKTSKVLQNSKDKFENICKRINLELQRQWNLFSESLQFFIQGKILYCRIKSNHKNYIFLLPETDLEIKIGENLFERIWHIQSEFIDKKLIQQNISFLFKIDIPQFDEDNVWQPDIQVFCGVKFFDQETLLKYVENDRVGFIQE